MPDPLFQNICEMFLCFLPFSTLTAWRANASGFEDEREFEISNLFDRPLWRSVSYTDTHESGSHGRAGALLPVLNTVVYRTLSLIVSKLQYILHTQVLCPTSQCK